MGLVIQDETALLRFIEWLPSLTEQECYYGELFARKKYNKAVVSDRNGLGRFTAMSKPDLLLAIRRLDSHAYFIDKYGNIVPNDSIALYICMNPRNYRRGDKQAVMEFIKHIDNPQRSLRELTMTETHKAKSTTHFVDFDFDLEKATKRDVTALKHSIASCINSSAYTLLDTRGGFHLLVNPKEVVQEYKATWHQALSKLPFCDVTGDNMIPVPGTIQGGFVPVMNY